MQEQRDLFGQVPVTWPEVVDWCARVAGITPDSPRFLPYVRAWRVPEKIAAAKAWLAFEETNTPGRRSSDQAQSVEL